MAATQLFINVAASDISKALVRSPTDLNPIAFPKLVVGDGRSYELYFVDGQGGYAPFSGDGSYIPYIAIGECGYPSGGTAVWHFNGQQTAALPYNVSPAALQTALQALSSIGSGNIAVQGVAGKYYVMTFQGALGSLPQPEITVDFAGLVPASTVDISTLVEGSASPATNEVQLATLAENPITFADDWTPITNGWTGSLSTRTLGIIEAFAAAGGTLSQIFQVTVADAVGVRTTYAKVAATIQCTIINPESFAGTDKPLLATQAALNAAVLGLGNFTREALASAVNGNTNVTRPTSGSRHHLARVSFSGSGVDRKISLLTSNAPNPGDFIFVALLPTQAYAYRYRIYNATTGGTLLADVQATDRMVPYLLAFAWSGSAWQLNMDLSIFLAKADNLAGLADVGESKQNLRALFANIANPSASFAAVLADEGTLFRVNASGGPVAITLPAANTVPEGFLLAVQKFDAGPQVVTTIPPTLTLSRGGMTAVIQSDGNDWNIVFAYDPLATPPTIAEVVQNRYDLTTLAAIRAEATAGGAVQTNAAWWVPEGTGGIWVLEDSTAADDGISVLRPDDFDLTTNPRTWNLKMRGAPAALEEGDILYFDGEALVRLPIGLAGQVLRVKDDLTAPEWSDVDASVVSAQAVALSAAALDVTPENPVHTARVAVTGTARTTGVNVLAPASPAPGAVCKLKFAMPATAAILVQIVDDESAAVLLTLSSDDGGGSAQKTFVELGWDGANWVVNFVVSPTPF